MSNTPSPAVEVTQADRDAASFVARLTGWKGVAARLDNGWRPEPGTAEADLIEFLARYRSSPAPAESGAGADVERAVAKAMAWQPIETAPMWQVAIVIDVISESVAIAQKAEADHGGHYWSIDPEDALDWEPTHWISFPLPPRQALGGNHD